MVFEFLSKLDRKESDQRLVFYKFQSQIGNKIYERSVISSCFPLFLQINHKDFSGLQEKGYVSNVLSLEKFINCVKREREKLNLDDEISNEDLEDESLFDDQENVDLCPENSEFKFKMNQIPIEEPLKEYRVKNIGFSDILVEGAYNKMIFKNIRIADGFLERKIFLVGNLLDLLMNLHLENMMVMKLHLEL